MTWVSDDLGMDGLPRYPLENQELGGQSLSTDRLPIYGLDNVDC